VAFPPPTAFENLGALVLGHHALHLHEHLILGRLPKTMGEKDHLDARTCELEKRAARRFAYLRARRAGAWT
jgi:hypothetical protein